MQRIEEIGNSYWASVGRLLLIHCIWLNENFYYDGVLASGLLYTPAGTCQTVKARPGSLASSCLLWPLAQRQTKFMLGHHSGPVIIL